MNSLLIDYMVGLQLILRLTLDQTIRIGNSFTHSISVATTDSNIVMGIDMSIEGLRSQKYSVGIFVFLLISLVFFGIIIYMYMPKGKEGLKTGEKYMFGAIIAGIFIAIAVGWLELIEGYLI